jgi:very-short-patch-repair endonuclease
MSEWRIHSVQQLRDAGWTRTTLTDAVESRRLWRIRKGYYAEPSADRSIVRAVRLGGVATGTTALRAWGAWTAPGDKLHVLVPANGARWSDPDHRFEPLGDRGDVHVHWQRADPVRPTLHAYSPVAPPILAIEHAFACTPSDLVIASCDSALQQRLVRPVELDALQGRLPPRFAGRLAECDGRAQSGAESIVRVRLRRRGLRVTVQRRVDRVGSVDVIVEGRLVIETDGREFHDTDSQFVEDRRRDRVLAGVRYRVLRFTQQQVLYSWPECEAAILAALA